MESFEDDDDTHYCNKCHATINGLENYVRHRQSGCRPIEDKPESVYHCPASSVSYPEILNADAFFSSLELQSSSKPTLPRARGSDFEDGTRLRRSYRNEERRRRQRKDTNKSPVVDEKEESSKLLPVDADLDDIGMPSLVGFPEIVQQSSGKQTVAASSTTSTSGKTARTTDHHLEDEMLCGADLAASNEGKEELGQEEEDHHRLDGYVDEDEDFNEDYQSDSDSDSLVVDLQDSFSESDEPENQEPDDPKYPPRSHTGGRWKPEVVSQREEPPEEVAEEPHPPDGHTGGKWQPDESSVQDTQKRSEDYENKEAPPPPPNHTRGKWIPGARSDVGTGYWCSPCGRKLASRLVYNRHLLSDLHARRSIQEIDGVPMQMPRGLGLLNRRKLTDRQKLLAKRKSEESAKRSAQKDEEQQKRKKRLRRKEFLSCEMCGVRVRRAQMGKHLLSHYHCRVAGAKPSSAQTRRFLLENMANIVRQCPFQCASCRFYCNTGDTFLRHWRSEEHKDAVAKIEGSFVCNLCDFWCDDNESVEAHVTKQGHQDVVSMINGSMPIVIRRQRVLVCSTCCRRFRYNVQLRSHAKKTGHELGSSASDEYQGRLSCGVCGHVAWSPISLQRHQLTCHKPVNGPVAQPYFCSFCSLSFETAREAVLHRRTSSHKETVKRKKLTVETSRSCPHCPERQENLAEHKEHLLERHRELCYRCAKCGKQFALSQDVTKHTRENRCSQDKEATAAAAAAVKKPGAEQWSCSVCPFASDSQSEFLFHKALVHESPGADSKPKYKCPICKRRYRKSALREHIRSHIGEKPFSCGKCGMSFARRSDAKVHQKRCEGQHRERKYRCDECGNGFYDKHTLRQHMMRHVGKQYKCGLPGCPTILRTEIEFKQHRRLVHDSTRFIREFRCNDCDYAAKTKRQLINHRRKHGYSDTEGGRVHVCEYDSCSFSTDSISHMKRHVRFHTGKTPYRCRFCDYASKNLENLRKHVLSTSLHPGRMIYQCPSCRNGPLYQTNFSKELKAHLLNAHPAEYPTPKDASNYVATIFDV